jgi:hypothetical protein
VQRRGIKLNPITTLYLIAPCCFAFLCIPFVSLQTAAGSSCSLPAVAHPAQLTVDLLACKLPMLKAPHLLCRRLLQLLADAQAFIELPKILNDETVKLSPLIFLTNASAAFGGF